MGAAGKWSSAQTIEDRVLRPRLDVVEKWTLRPSRRKQRADIDIPKREKIMGSGDCHRMTPAAI
jgi:hypothetical protein